MFIKWVSQLPGGGTKGCVEAKTGKAHKHNQDHHTEGESWGECQKQSHSITGCKGCRNQLGRAFRLVT